VPTTQSGVTNTQNSTQPTNQSLNNDQSYQGDVPKFPDIPTFPSVNTNVNTNTNTTTDSQGHSLPPGARPTPFVGQQPPPHPSTSNNFPQPPITKPNPTPTPTPTPTIPTPVYNPPQSGSYIPSDQDLQMAAKYSKFIVSSLQYDDVQAAVKNCRLTLKHLTGSEH